MSTAVTQLSSLDLSTVKPADIILSTTPSVTSGGIRLSTCGKFSHAILALPNGYCIEALPDKGVRIEKLSKSLSKATYAAQYRHKFIDDQNAIYVCHFAKMQQNKEYDFAGAARSGISSGCGGAMRYTKHGFIVELVHDAAQKRKHNNKFFCSELIASSFEKAGLRLLDLPSHAISPTAIATSSKITMLEELITA
jgi:hypothetical protein